MTHMSSEEYHLLMAQRGAKIIDGDSDTHEADEGPESALQSKIKAHCKAKGWPILSFPSTPAVKRFLPPGWPDDTIILPFGTVLFLEDKTKIGRVSPKQKLMRNMFATLGHVIHEVRSFKKFLEIVEGVMRMDK